MAFHAAWALRMFCRAAARCFWVTMVSLLSAKALSGLDLDGSALARLGLGERHAQDAVAVRGLHLVGVDVRGQRHRAVEVLVPPFAIAPLFLLGLGLVGRAEDQLIAAHLDVEVGRLEA